MSRLQNEKEEEEEEEEGATYYGGGTDRPTHALTPGSSRNIKGEKQKKEWGNIIHFCTKTINGVPRQ